MDRRWATDLHWKATRPKGDPMAAQTHPTTERPTLAARPRSRGDTSRPHQAWTVVIASLGVFMTALDTLVVTTSLPVLRASLHASLSSLEWTVNAYNLAFACMLLTGAALGDRFGRRRMFTIGIGVFTAASAAAALSPSVGALIAARAVQGGGRGDRDAADADADQRGVPGREARRGDRAVGRHHRASPSPRGRSSAARSSAASTGTGSSGSTCRSGSR